MSKVALIGAGNMARAMARGWRAGDGGPAELIICDSGSGRSETLAAETGAVAVESAEEAFSQADISVLAVKPAGLKEVANQGRDYAGTIVSLIAGIELSVLQKEFPEANCIRVMPNVAVEKRRGVLCLCTQVDAGASIESVTEHLSSLGLVIEVPERLFDAATAIMGCTPAYFALVAEAVADAGVRSGLGGEMANLMVTETLAGTAELLGDRDTLAVRRAVTSPGGSTAAGLAALERGAIRAAFAEAVAVSIARMQE